ncbi:hypothetical protein SASPL_106983 [Salvia splendens]|uniref:Auxin-responsive protein n=1 Tax=Salvia splendens TaxID=180675 RepID=A0A8X8YC60_SALSN|nr:hypothetical protein SASPL_106983 [Salvia splendens]
MEDYSREDEGCPQLLDLIAKGGEWVGIRAVERSHGISEEKKLELRLAPPGGEWSFEESNTTISRERNGLFSLGPCPQNTVLKPPSPWQHLQTSYLHPVRRESSQLCSNRAAAETKAFSAANTAMHNTAQKRKNIASGSFSKQASDSPDVAPSKVSTVEKSSRTPFVKINMDGVPIGRKVDLKSYNTYEKLSFAVDELFRGLLAVQKKSCSGGIKDEGDGVEKIGGLLDGSGEYTLVYEDHEGDRMLVGDVPWHMFVSTVKRLRVLKTSELSALSRELSTPY